MFSDVRTLFLTSDCRRGGQIKRINILFMYTVSGCSIGCTLLKMKVFTYLNAIYSVWLLEADLVKNPSCCLHRRLLQRIFFLLIEYRSLSNMTFCNEGVMFLNLEVVRDSYIFCPYS